MVSPVVLKVPGMDAYATFERVLYLQVDASLVVTLRVAVVVLAANVPDGEPEERTGGVISTELETVTEILEEVA